MMLRLLAVATIGVGLSMGSEQLSAQGQPLILVPPPPQPPIRTPFVVQEDVNKRARLLDSIEKTAHIYGWAWFSERVVSSTEEAARIALRDKPDGTSVVIHAGSTERIDPMEAPYVPAPNRDSLVVSVTGEGATAEEALLDSYTANVIKADTQTHRVSLATRRGNQIEVRAVRAKDVQKVAGDALAADRRAAEDAAKRARDQADRQKAEAERREAAERVQQYNEARRNADKCVGDECPNARRRLAEEIEKAQTRANTALCAPPDGSFSADGGGPCGGPEGCPECSSALTERERYIDWQLLSERYDALGVAMPGLERSMKGLYPGIYSLPGVPRDSYRVRLK